LFRRWSVTRGFDGPATNHRRCQFRLAASARP
jgi:hypothetical protein